MKKIIFILTTMSAFSFPLIAQSESEHIRNGNKYYNSGKFTEAEIEYRKGQEKNKNSFEANFNLANSLFRQEKYSEAINQYSTARALSENDKMKLAAGFHNAGNALLGENKLEESIEAFKNSLRNNPNDNETRYNLAYTQALLKKQQQDPPPPEDKEQEEEQQQQQEQQPPPPPNPNQMSKENAEQILNALMQDEKETQEKVKKIPAKGSRRAEKDW